MYDLIGFWTSVTLQTIILLASPLALLCWLGSELVSSASRNRVDLLDMCVTKIAGGTRKDVGFDDWWVAKNTVMNIFTGLLLGGTLLGAVLLAFLYDDFNASTGFIQAVAALSTVTALIMGTVGIIATIFGGGFIILRKVFDVYFAVSEKLSKLEEKE